MRERQTTFRSSSGHQRPDRRREWVESGRAASGRRPPDSRSGAPDIYFATGLTACPWQPHIVPATGPLTWLRSLLGTSAGLGALLSDAGRSVTSQGPIMSTLHSDAELRKPSRALNLNLSQAQIEQLCSKHDAAISAIEPLPGGGTRVVLMNISDADVVRRACSRKLITGDVPRTPFFRHR